MTAVSLTLIARNEESNLADCLSCVADLVQEIVVIDTGSKDRSREVARRFGAHVYDFPWCDDFAAARNEALRHASSPWIFWMDADDRLDPPNRDRLRALFASLGDENAAYLMKCAQATSSFGTWATWTGRPCCGRPNATCGSLNSSAANSPTTRSPGSA
ncbi:MAG: glycosyltransferase family 2 protein [Pirellulales bacterium]